MFPRILGGLALVFAGSAMTLAASPFYARGGEWRADRLHAVAERQARCELPPGHPPVETCLPVHSPPAGSRALPPGHPLIGPRQLPPGHPPVNGMPGDGIPGHVLPLAPGQPGADGFPAGYVTAT
jgi:hypothetical protein